MRKANKKVVGKEKLEQSKEEGKIMESFSRVLSALHHSNTMFVCFFEWTPHTKEGIGYPRIQLHVLEAFYN